MGGRTASHRLFFALVPAGETLEAIRAIQRRVPHGSARAVPAERLHSTLAFLGNQPPANLERARVVAAELEFTPCVLTLDRVGHFPRSRVGWLGSSQIPRRLTDFHECLCAGLLEAEIPFDDRPWQPHVTLYRNLRMRPETISFEPVEWTVREFLLMESTQDQRGLQYIRRGQWPA